MCSASSYRRGCVSLWPLAVSMRSMHEHMRPTLSLLALFLLRSKGSKGKGQKMKAQKGGAVDDDRDELTKTMDMDL